jgi:hypothetical protein
MTGTVMYEDEYGSTIDRPDANFIEIRWYDATASFTTEGFNVWLARFAGAVEAVRRPAVLVDSVQFKMDLARMDRDWRDVNIIPRYNKAGVRKFAFLMPEGMPAIGTPPAVEGPADFPTAYFGNRADALAWLAAD